MARAGTLPVGLMLSGKVVTAGTLTQGVILVISIVLIKEKKKVSVCKVNPLSTVCFMNNAYMQLVHLFIDSFCLNV